MIPESVTESWNGSGRKRPGSSSPNPLLGGKLGGRRQRTGAGKGKRLIQAHPGSLQCFSRWFFLLPLVAWAGPGAGKGFASCLEPWGSLSLLRTGFLGMPVGSRLCGHTAEPRPNIPASFVPGTPFPAPFRWKWLVNTSPHILSHGTRRSCCSSGRMRRNRRFSLPAVPFPPLLPPPHPDHSTIPVNSRLPELHRAIIALALRPSLWTFPSGEPRTLPFPCTFKGIRANLEPSGKSGCARSLWGGSAALLLLGNNLEGMDRRLQGCNRAGHLLKPPGVHGSDIPWEDLGFLGRWEQHNPAAHEAPSRAGGRGGHSPCPGGL